MDNIMSIMEEIGIPYAYDHFAEGEAPEPPFICFLYPGSDNFAADGWAYFKVDKGEQELTLYEMLDKAMAHQKVWIFEQNTYDQNMPLFKGTVNEARIDPELKVWDFLMCEVELYDCSNEILDIRVKDGNYNERLEEHYLFNEKWDRWDKNKRPWRYSIEISEEKIAEGRCET